jgi:hypothetical protein
VLLLAAIPAAAGTVRVEKADEAMGSTFSVVLYGSDRVVLEAAATAALDEAHRLELSAIERLEPSQSIGGTAAGEGSHGIVPIAV